MTKRLLTTAAVAAAMMAGCGDADGPKLVSVKGTVMYDDKPLEGAMVRFVPDGSNAGGLPASDVTGPKGDYSAMSNGRRGMVPGKYKVTVSKVEANQSASSDEEHKVDPRNRLKMERDFNKQVAQKSGKKVQTGSGSIQAIEGTFEREVSGEGGVIDFDVKAQTTSK